VHEATTLQLSCDDVNFIGTANFQAGEAHSFNSRMFPLLLQPGSEAMSGETHGLTAQILADINKHTCMY